MVLPSCEMSQFRELKTKCSRSEYRKLMEAEHERRYSSILASLDMPIKLLVVFFLAAQESEGGFGCFYHF